VGQATQIGGADLALTVFSIEPCQFTDGRIQSWPRPKKSCRGEIPAYGSKFSFLGGHSFVSIVQ
jgi:hypothetical protein